MSRRYAESTDELLAMRRDLLVRYVCTGPSHPDHKEIGRKITRIGKELNRRTGESKYKR